MIRLATAAAFAAALSVAAAPALAETFPVKMASYQKGYFKGFTSVALPSYNFTLITANQATAVGGGAASRLNAVLVGIDQAEMRKMADEAHADLRAQFVAAGIPVADDATTGGLTKANGVAFHPGNYEAVKVSGGITLNKSLRQSWASVGPTAAPMLTAYKPDLTNTSGSNYAAQARMSNTLAKGHPDGALLVMPTLVLDFAAMEAGASTNLRGTTATTSGKAAFAIRGVASGISYAKVYNKGKAVFAFYTRPEGDYYSKAPFATALAGAATVAPTNAFGDNASRGDAVVVDVPAWEGLVRDAYRAYNAQIVKAALSGK